MRVAPSQARDGYAGKHKILHAGPHAPPAAARAQPTAAAATDLLVAGRASVAMPSVNGGTWSRWSHRPARAHDAIGHGPVGRTLLALVVAHATAVMRQHHAANATRTKHTSATIQDDTVPLAPPSPPRRTCVIGSRFNVQRRRQRPLETALIERGSRRRKSGLAATAWAPGETGVADGIRTHNNRNHNPVFLSTSHALRSVFQRVSLLARLVF